MTIRISHEEKKEIDAYFKSAGVKFVREHLVEGDFTNDNEDFIAERKKTFDLVSSLISKHVWVQLSRMRLKHPKTPLFLIFEGDYETLIESQTVPGIKAMLQCFPFKLSHIYGCQFIQTWDTLETVEKLKTLDWCAKKIKDNKVEFEPTLMKREYDERIRTLMVIPMLGQAGATRAIKKYKSLENVLDACVNNPKKIMELKGWGKGTVEKVIRMFKGNKPFIKKINEKKATRTNKQNTQANKAIGKKYAMQRQKYTTKAKKHV